MRTLRFLFVPLFFFCTTGGGQALNAQWAPAWSSVSEDLAPESPTCGAVPDTLSRRFPTARRFSDVNALSDSGFVVVGVSQGGDFLVSRLDCQAQEQWSTVVAAPGSNNGAVAAFARGDGSIWAAGAQSPASGGLTDGAIIAFNGMTGTPTDTLLLGGTALDGFTAMEPTTGGGAVACGYWNSFGQEDAWLVRVDANLDTTWTLIQDDGQDERFNDVLVADDGSMYAAGRKRFPVIGLNLNQGLLQRLDANGNVLWLRQDVDSVEWFDMAPQPGGGVVVTGRLRISATDQRLAAAAYDASGSRLWYETYGTPGQAAFGGSIVQTSTGYAIGGRRSDDSTAWLLHLDFAGQLQESVGILHASGEGHVFTEIMALNDGDRFAATGFFGPTPSNNDAWFWIGRIECYVSDFDPLPDDVSVCAGDAAVLDAGSGFASYAWSTGQTTQQISVSTPGWYVVSVVDADGCFGMDSVLVGVNPLPMLDLGADTLSACGVDSLTLDAGSGFASYAWNTGATTSSISVSSGWYSVTVTDANGCQAMDSVLVDLLNIGISPGDTAICAGETVELTTMGPVVLWSTGETTASISVSPTATTTYAVTVSNGITSCTDSVTVTVGPSIAPPQFDFCPANISVVGEGPVGWTEPTAEDNCYAPISIVQIAGPANGSVFAEGETQIVYVASDTIGQTDTCRFTVSVSVPCSVPTALSAIPASNGVILSWFDDPEHLGVQIKGRRLGDAFFATTQTTSSTLAVGGLASGTSYEWRVRAKCLDGDISGFSPLDTFTTLSLRGTAHALRMELYPNPAVDQVGLFWTSPGSEVLLQISDALGRVVWTRTAAGTGQVHVDATNWQPGWYVLTVRSDHDRSSRRFLLMDPR